MDMTNTVLHLQRSRKRMGPGRTVLETERQQEADGSHNRLHAHPAAKHTLRAVFDSEHSPAPDAPLRLSPQPALDGCRRPEQAGRTG
ncbi:MAG: hypothetical protein WDW38_005541 [Sanguina aurantia]